MLVIQEWHETGRLSSDEENRHDGVFCRLLDEARDAKRA